MEENWTPVLITSDYLRQGSGDIGNRAEWVFQPQSGKARSNRVYGTLIPEATQPRVGLEKHD
jgi:hypothetical protein